MDAVIESLRQFAEDRSDFVDSDESILPVLEVVLEEPRARVRLAALAMLAGLGAPPEEVGPLLRQRLRDPAPEVREAAAQVLGSLESED